MQLREYQIQAHDAVIEKWKEFNRTLLVMPTGCG